MYKHTKPILMLTRFLVGTLAVIMLLSIIFSLSSCYEKAQAQTIQLVNPWENMGTDVTQVSTGNRIDYEWGVRYNGNGPVFRVTCNSWNSGQRVCTYPPYPTDDTNPFTWGGSCWFWGTASTWDDGCSAYHSYYTEDAQGRYNMSGGNGCNSLPTVYRRRL